MSEEELAAIVNRPIEVRAENGNVIRVFPTLTSFSDWVKPAQICANFTDIRMTCEECSPCGGLIVDRHKGVPKEVAQQVCSIMSQRLAKIDSLTMNHHFKSNDVLWSTKPSTSCGCASDPNWSQTGPGATLCRVHRFRNMTEKSSFGPGGFSHYDVSLRLFEQSGTNRIHLFDPLSLHGRELVDEDTASVRDGQFLDVDTEAIGGLQLLDASGEAVTELSDAHQALLLNKHGDQFRFDLFDQAGSEPEWAQDLERDRILRLNGNHFVEVTGYQGVTGSSARTVSTWVHMMQNKGGTILSWGKNKGGKRWTVRVNGSQGVKGALRAEVNGGYIVGSTDLRDGQWHHVAAVLPSGASDITEVLLYVDGQLETVSASKSKVINTVANGNVKIGDDHKDNRFEGDLDEVRVYSRDLTAAEVADLASETANSSLATGLEGHWQMEESSGSTVADSSANNRSGLVGNVDAELVGRLTEMKNRNGYGVTLSYRYDLDDPSITQQELDDIAESPSRQWQIETVVDANHRTMTFEYAAEQVSGRWAVSKVTMPNGEETTYTYDSGNLSTITHPDGTQSGISYGVAGDMVVVKYDSAAAEGPQRKQTVFLSGDINVQGTDKGYQLYTQASMMVRGVVNGMGELEYFNASKQDQNLNYRVIYTGSGQLAHQKELSETRYYSDWSIGTGDGYASITGTQEPKFSTFRSGNDKRDKRLAQPKNVKDSQGINYVYEYNGKGFPTKKTFNDATVERWSYNQYHQVTRHEDRLGRVTLNSYDANGNQLTSEVGIVNTKVFGQSAPDVSDPPVDQQVASEYAVYQSSYYNGSEGPAVATGDNSVDNRAAATQPANFLKSTTDANGNVTHYIYDANNFQIAEIQPADILGDARPFNSFTYDSAGRLASSTDAMNRTTSYTYDPRDRIIQVAYSDGSTERTAYGNGANGTENLVVARQDRNGNVTSFEYDATGRITNTITASHQLPTSLVTDLSQTDLLAMLPGNEITDPSVRVESTCEYLPGTELCTRYVSRGEVSEHKYDYRHRMIETTAHPRDGQSLTSKTVYKNNLLFSTEDPYGRKTYNAYRTSDNALIRTIQATRPNVSGAPTNNNSILNKVRAGTPDTPAANTDFLIRDVILDAAGQQIAFIDPRSIVSASAFDSRGREYLSVEAAATLPPYNQGTFDPTDDGQLLAISAKTQTIYDANSNVIETRTPRYFDNSDTNGHQTCSSTMTYTGRNLLATQTEAAGADAYVEGHPTSVKVTSTYTYYPDGRQKEQVDARGNTSESLWHQCCGRYQGNLDPLGHGTIQNTDYYGNVTHRAVVDDLQSLVSANANGLNVVTDAHNPPNDHTLNETTSQYDARNRLSATTNWLIPLDTVDPNDVPIAGVDGESLMDNGELRGLTTRYYYDENLTDGQGLDGGQTVSNLGGTGNFTLDISDLLSELGSDGTTIGTNGDFSATAIVNPEGEIQVNISDAVGRNVASGIIEQDGTPITWATTGHDTIVNNLVETQHTDALNHTTKNRNDAAGRTLESEDAEGNLTTVSYDGNNNRISYRDANGVGQDCTFDYRNRDVTCTDTHGDTTSREYDKENNIVKQIDAKLNETECKFDARNRRYECINRINSVVQWRYDQNSNLLQLLDGDNQAAGGTPTIYTYDARNLKISEAYPGHNPSSNIGDPDYDLVSLSYDAARRMNFKTDQQGDTQTRNYDMANRLVSRDYRTAANSPSGKVADDDSFTYDAASRMLTATSKRYNNTCTYTYDNAGRKTSEALTVSGQTYTVQTGYDNASRKTQITYPDGSTVDRAYTDRNQLTEIQYNGNIVDTRTYDPGMRLDTQTAGNGIVTNYGYRADNLTSSITRTGLAGADFTYSYDANKNKTAETISGVMAPYGFNTTTYDNQDRLTAWTSNGGNSQSWNLSLEGDWNSFTQGDTIRHRTHNAVHEIQTITTSPLSHDPKGNLTTNEHGQAYSWDFDNQMQTATIPASANQGIAGTHSYTYDAFGRRIAKTIQSPSTGAMLTTLYIHDYWQVISEYDIATSSSIPVRKLVFATYADEPILLTVNNNGNVADYYYHFNNVQCVSALTTSTGSVAERIAYDAYGVSSLFDASGISISGQSSTVGNPFFYTGRRYDEETLLYYYRARYYSDQIGRFLSRDPAGYSDGLNVYQYVSSNPLVHLDPSGKFKALGCKNSTIRIKLENCDCTKWKPRQGLIEKSMCKVADHSRKLANLLSQANSGQPQFGTAAELDRLQRCADHWFGMGNSAGPDVMRRIEAKVEAVADCATKPMTIRCDSDCKKGVFAYEYWGNIYLCDKWAKHKTRNAKLFHELTHKCAGTRDYGYVFSGERLGGDLPTYNVPCKFWQLFCDPEVGQPVVLSQQVLLNNAATYEGFAECVLGIALR